MGIEQRRFQGVSLSLDRQPSLSSALAFWPLVLQSLLASVLCRPLIQPESPAHDTQSPAHDACRAPPSSEPPSVTPTAGAQLFFPPRVASALRLARCIPRAQAPPARLLHDKVFFGSSNFKSLKFARTISSARVNGRNFSRAKRRIKKKRKWRLTRTSSPPATSTAFS